MTNRWRQVENLFHQAKQVAESDCAAFLDRACEGDVELRQEVESLLAQRTSDSSLWNLGALEEMTKELSQNRPAIVQGDRLGAYAVVSLLGKGGMGEVYRARDTKLGRDVAIKILPPSLALDPDRVARFDREARLLAALNHPNIATIHSVEEWDGRKFLVLELVEGGTLADRLKRGRISVEESLRIALQIAEALEAAHAKGVIHRDLKPANIQITDHGRVKVLDFGLAKIFTETNGTDGSHSPTVTSEPTGQGVLLGTAAYMSPEQARGAAVDQRTDIWAFGCVLYEMVAGNTLFLEKTATETIAKVLEGRIDLDTALQHVPLVIFRLIHRCLQRDPRERLQHIGDARVEIREVLAGSAARQVEKRVVRASRWRSLVWVGAVIVVAGLMGWFLARRTIPGPTTVTTRSFIGPIAKPTPQPFGMRHVAVSNDGTLLAYISGSQIFLRPMGRTQAAPASPAYVAVANPFFSTDGKWLAFAAFSDLKKVSVSGGAAVSIASFKGRNFGGTWGPDGTIIFATEAGLFRVSDQGGEPKLLIAPEGEGLLFVWPEFMPDGRSVLFTRLPAGSVEAAEIVLLDLKTLKSTIVVRGGAGAQYVPDGYLVYATSRGLQAIAFDPDTGKALTDAVLMPDVDMKIAADNGAADFAVSRNGTLVHFPPAAARLAQLIWVDLKGQEEVIRAIPPGAYSYPRLSPDGKRVAVDIAGPNRDIYVLDLERGSRVRLSEGPNEDLLPIWSADGRRVYYGSNRSGFHVYSRAADGTGTEELLIENPDVQMPFSLAPGNRLLFFKGPYQAADIGSVQLDHPTSVEWLLHSKYTERNPAVSPDGNWIAYESDESGQDEVWVRPYPDVDKARAPIGPGLHPRWSRRGNELYYRNPQWGMMAVSFQISPEFHAGTPRLVFSNNRYGTEGGVEYDIASDGRFLMPQKIGESGDSQIMISIALNWREELKIMLRH